MAAVTICSDSGVPENKVCHCFLVSSSFCYEMMELDAMIFDFWMLNIKPAFSLPSFTFIWHMVVYMLGEDNGTPLQYSCLENPMDRGAWWAAVCGVTQSRTWLKWLSSSSSSVYMSMLLFQFVTPSPFPHVSLQVLSNSVFNVAD